jgi:trk system potassium uptake protein
MDKQYAVIGLGKFGYAVAQTLSQAGKQVLAVDKDQELVQEIADYVTYAARADVTDSRVFESLGISNMDVVIVGISEDMESSILATLQAKEAGVPLVIAKGMNQMHAKILKKIGADRVVMAEIETGIRLGKNLISGGFQDFFMLSDSFSMVELAVPDSWIDHNLEELNLLSYIFSKISTFCFISDILQPMILLLESEICIILRQKSVQGRDFDSCRRK